MDMPGVLGLCLLVVVCGVGLVQLAVRRHPMEHRLGAAVVVGIAFPLLFVAPVVGVALLGASAGTRRLVRAHAVPDRLPPNWA
jgi:hypothetical protein